MTVESGRSREDGSLSWLYAAIGHEQRIPRAGSVVSKPGSFGRPVEFGDSFQIGPGLSAERRNRPGVDRITAGNARLANPKRDHRSVGGEPERSDRWIHQFADAPVGQVVELA